MNSITGRVRSTVLLAMFSIGLSACAACGPNLNDSEYEGSDGGTATGKPVAPAQQDGGMLPCDDTGCDTYPGDEPKEPVGGTGGSSGPSWVTVSDFNARGGFETTTSPSAPGWTPVGCAWGGGAGAVAEAKDAGTFGLRLSASGCRVESALVKVPDSLWKATLRTTVNAWGRPCPSEGCMRVTLVWRDSAGNPVVGTPPTYVLPTSGWIGYNVVASRPYNAVGLSVRFESLLPSGQGVYIDNVGLDVY